MMKRSGTWFLYALCAAAALSASAVDTATENDTGAHLRVLRQQEALNNQANGDQARGNNGDGEPAMRALHRVYDPTTGLYCERIGDCHSCAVSEKDEAYCRETGHRQELSCPKPSENGAPVDPENGPKEIRFVACSPVEKAQPGLRVLTFEIIMGGLLAGAFFLLKKERRKHMSSFDMRKDEKKQRGALLGVKNHD